MRDFQSSPEGLRIEDFQSFDEGFGFLDFLDWIEDFFQPLVFAAFLVQFSRTERLNHCNLAAMQFYYKTSPAR